MLLVRNQREYIILQLKHYMVLFLHNAKYFDNRIGIQFTNTL